ncbi:phage scaffolding protein [Halalkalibacterium halodurans]|uniref:phage scaffolding protein n=1 Tax=Halalkalibacterium halodurans TaxID=86665 RepID=UPI002E245282|nr:phage scaffolding protein [Halalkalibacterium halodurans]MED4084928.1 phage scaffolding protein [Halalkalibacterium halodurans]MED4104895.1 phage scaffolding protein [Halalkalibacterium halodurans]MED4110444.1 phage scaffolding protein [Halalkalibacterium halodurans]MED4123054.1 phage scaffolding protein [Halalkalibacterium halodurans]
MNREFLKELGLEDETIDKIMKEHGKSVNSIKEKADKADGLENQIEDYKQQLADRDTQLEELGEKVKDNEELTAKIDELKQQNETTKTEYEEKLQQQAFDHKLETALAGAKVKNTKAVKALLDMDMIKLDGDTLKGLDDQLSKLKESDDYLFESETDSQTPQIVTPGNPNGGSNSSGDDPFAAKLAKYQN